MKDKEGVSPKPDSEEEDVALDGLLDRLDTLYLVDFNKKMIGFKELENATRTSIKNYAEYVLSEYSQAYQLRQSEVLKNLYVELHSLESRLRKANDYLEAQGMNVKF